nr:chlorophyllase-1, chloroplastic [Malus domestica]
MGRRQSTSYNINLIAIASFVQFKSRKENEKENISTGRVHGIGDKNSEIGPQPLTQGDRYTEETPLSSCFDSSAPPKPLFIVTPTVAGTYPVILLHHGFYLSNYFYKELLQHIASHGFVAVAPQLCGYVPPSGPEEIELGAKVINWLPKGLQSLLPENVVADFTKFALAGRSKGGKTAFATALGHAKSSLSLKISVLIGIDPVGPRELMRKAVGEIVVAFLKAYLNGDDRDLVAIVGDPDISPAKLDHVEFIRA